MTWRVVESFQAGGLPEVQALDERQRAALLTSDGGSTVPTLPRTMAAPHTEVFNRQRTR